MAKPKAQKYHISKDGTPGVCTATGACPLGGVSGVENHFYASSPEEIAEKVDKIHTEEYIKEQMTPEQKQALIEGEIAVRQARERQAEINEKYGYKDFDAKEKKAFKSTEKYYEFRKEQKDAFYERMMADKQVKEAMGETFDPYYEEEKTGEQLPTSSRPSNPHPGIDSKKRKAGARNARQTISAISGYSEDEVNEKISEKMAQGMDENEAYMSVYAEAPMRTDKKFMAINLGMAGANVHGQPDWQGHYSDVVSVEMSNYDVSEAKMSSSTAYASPSPKVKELVGNGKSNAPVEKTEGKKTFEENKAQQRRILNNLKSSVLVSHDKTKTIETLRAQLPGFGEAVDNGEIEILDSREASKAFTPHAEANSHGEFIKAAGIKSQPNSAKTLLNATLRNKNILRESLAKK